MKAIALPVLIIALGLGWLLTAKGILPGVDWAWVLGLGVMGIVVLAAAGIDKVTVVLGPLLIVASVFALLRQTGRITVDVEVPALVIALGSLLLVAKVLPVPQPKWMNEPAKKA